MSIIEPTKENIFWKYFEEISAIPRGSGHTDAISDYVVEFAKKRGLKYTKDAANNVVIFKGASKDVSGDVTVMLQSHLDMVTVKRDEKEKDFLNEGIDLIIDGDFLTADGTTLGADDGIGVAYALAVLDSDDISHPDIEAVFTTDEEIGMLGAAAMDMSDLKSDFLLNIDSEEEGVFTAGCAGSTLCEISMGFTKENETGTFYRISISGLTGGHSGIEIDKNRGNAYRLLGRLMLRLSKEGTDVRYVLVDGGGKDNAIAQSCEATVFVKSDADAFRSAFIKESKKITDAYNTSDPGIKIECAKEGIKKDAVVVSEGDSKKITALLTELPDGVVRMYCEPASMPETSLNLGIVKVDTDNIDMTICLRSNVESQRQYLKEVVENIACRIGADVAYGPETEIWDYVKDSKLCDIITKAYEKVSGKSAVVNVIHAGVECGIFAKKIPGIECISFGPDILDIHTFNERINIPSAEVCWKTIKETLREFST